jgi:hypothetical protein
VVGVDRGGNREALAAHGADLVVADLGELATTDLDARVTRGAGALSGSAPTCGSPAARRKVGEALE